MNPNPNAQPQQAALEDVLLLLNAVIADLTHVRNRHTPHGGRPRLSGSNPAATLAGQIRTLNRRTDPFSLAVRQCLQAVADGIEEAGRAGV